jgi:hypothetical protein
MTYDSSSAAPDVRRAPFGVRIIRAMQPSAARGEKAERVAKHDSDQDWWAVPGSSLRSCLASTIGQSKEW